jgi:hypothetical protein
MSGSDKEQVVGVAQIAADDRLLDALGRGEAPEGDAAVTMLAAWRADLASDVEEELPPPLSAGDPRRKLPAGDPRPKLPAGDPRRKRRLVQAILGAAAAAVVAVGLAVSAHQAQPGSPLWPVSKVVYPQRAEVVAAEKAIADARAAAAGGRIDEARALLATASAHIARIDDRATADRLRAEVEALLRDLAAASPPSPPAAPAPPGSSAGPVTPGASPSAPAAPGAKPPPADEGGPAPRPSPSSPDGPLPDLPLPLPSLPLPSLPLPTLPPILG